jgi:hypothetical protein
MNGAECGATAEEKKMCWREKNVLWDEDDERERGAFVRERARKKC